MTEPMTLGPEALLTFYDEKGQPQALFDHSNLSPKASVWHDEVVHPGVARELLVPKLRSEFSDFLQVNITDALEEQKCKDVAPELRVINIAAQDVGGFVKEVI
jgi:hypothetical protein